MIASSDSEGGLSDQETRGTRTNLRILRNKDSGYR